METKSVVVTYDLSPFYLSDDVYIVKDSDESHFEYYFNVLANIEKSLLPTACKNATGSCDFDTTDDCSGDELDTVDATGAAFQYNNETNVCNLVGTVDSEDDYTWSLMDSADDPAKGVVLTYTKGGYCSDYNVSHFTLLCVYLYLCLCVCFFCSLQTMFFVLFFVCNLFFESKQFDYPCVAKKKHLQNKNKIIEKPRIFNNF